MKFIIMLAVNVLLLGSFSAGTEAQWHNPGARSRGFHEAGLFEKLDLSDAQREAMQRIFTAYRENLSPVFQQLRDQRALLREAAMEQPFDEESVRFQAQELAKIQAELMVQRAAMMHQVSSLLTPEQLAKLQELRAERKSRFREEREKRRQRRADPRSS